ncbi:primosomal replication protein PriC [Erwinia tasmaniensis]|uniref:Primosomal replication protein N n=1 Tax=Erwinia tasmaniensis (strain DSM 17950 / CFBP 7177 / CIP 109463 / NCPPB 4357 / Et1/99) TaxID=465817 RepID=B2VHV1_ERWT9|nr:primosomal replication protein [Erwinia tasmaniensis]CAO97523.1 Primosomal replication protein N'' [Erwinia tasmaniensis Et1/99]
MKSAVLLQQLEIQVEKLAQAVEPHANKRTTQARFDHQLFHCHSTRLGDYLLEIRQNLARLTQSVSDNRTVSVAWMSERVVLQIGALQREIATQKMRSGEARPVALKENLYEKLAEHQDFERRLRAMIGDRESLLAQQETLIQQQQLQRELAALEGRLQRCLQALKRIERAIENRERGL